MTDYENKYLKRTYVNQELNKSSGFNFLFFRVLGVILFALILISFIRKIYTGTPITFSSFLNWLGNLNSFNLKISVSDFSILADWGLFNGFRDFLNIFTTLVGVLVWLGSNLINLLVFVSQFLYFIFA